VDSAERKHQEATQALERAKVRHQRLHKIFVDVRIGLEHLCARLDPARHGWTVTEDNLVEVMQHCESRLEKLLASRGGAHASAGAPDLSTAKSNLRVRLDAEEDTVVEEDREVEGAPRNMPFETRLGLRSPSRPAVSPPLGRPLVPPLTSRPQAPRRMS